MQRPFTPNHASCIMLLAMPVKIMHLLSSLSQWTLFSLLSHSHSHTHALTHTQDSRPTGTIPLASNKVMRHPDDQKQPSTFKFEIVCKFTPPLLPPSLPPSVYVHVHCMPVCIQSVCQHACQQSQHSWCFCQTFLFFK